MDQGGRVKLFDYMVKTNGFVLMPVLDKQNCAADQISRQRQKAATDKGLAKNGVAGEIHVGKAVYSAVSHFRALRGHIEQCKKGNKVQWNQKNGRRNRGRTGSQDQNGQYGRQGHKRVADAVFKVDKANTQHHAKQRHGQGGVVSTEQTRQQADK